MLDITEIRSQLHLPDEVVALNAGSWGPLCEAARKAILDGYQAEAGNRGDAPELMKEKGSGLTRYTEVVDEARTNLSAFLGCRPDEVALCDSTTTGMNIFLWGYDWAPGDEVVAGSLENPAAKVPLMVVAKRRGVKLRYMGQLMEGDVSEALKDLLTERTRVVLLSDVNYADGSRVDLAEAAKIAHGYGALLLADGIQAVGTVPVDVKSLGIDGYALARHKFLCGPDGAGALYVKREVFDCVHPTFTGVFSDAKHGASSLEPADSAQRYEVSTRPLPVIQGGTAAVRWIMDSVGLHFIIDRTRRLYASLWDQLSDASKVDMISGRDQNSLMSFTVRGVDSGDAVETLRKRNIFTRTVGIYDPPAIRVSVGFWNRESDMNSVAEVVKSLA